MADKLTLSDLGHARTAWSAQELSTAAQAVETTRDALLVRVGEAAAEGIDRLIRAVEKRCAARITAEFTGISGPDWEDAAALIDPDEES